MLSSLFILTTLSSLFTSQLSSCSAWSGNPWGYCNVKSNVDSNVDSNELVSPLLTLNILPLQLLNKHHLFRL